MHTPTYTEGEVGITSSHQLVVGTHGDRSSMQNPTSWLMVRTGIAAVKQTLCPIMNVGKVQWPVHLKKFVLLMDWIWEEGKTMWMLQIKVIANKGFLWKSISVITCLFHPSLLVFFAFSLTHKTGETLLVWLWEYFNQIATIQDVISSWFIREHSLASTSTRRCVYMLIGDKL